MKNLSNLWVIAFFLVPGLCLAQTDIEPATNVDWSTASDQQVLLQAIEQTTPEPTNDLPIVATFYSAQHSPLSSSPWPPLPGNINNLTGWNLGGGVWLLDDLNFNYSAPMIPTMQAGPMMMTMDDSGPLPPGSGGGGTNILYPAGGSSFNPGTNLWIAQEAVSGGNFTGILSNTVADVEYQLLFVNSLGAQWEPVPDGIVVGSEITNYTPWSVPYEPTTNFFLTALSYQDDSGTGIPDWWWLDYYLSLRLMASTKGCLQPHCFCFQRTLMQFLLTAMKPAAMR